MVALRDGIVLVIVAVRAFERESEPGHAERAHAVGNVLDAIFLVDDAALGVDDVIAPEAGGDALLERRVRQQVAGKLLGEEAIVRHVGVEALQHPVAPAPHGPRGIVVEAMRVGVAGDVQPVHCHALAVAGRGKQAVDGGAIGGFALGLLTLQKRVDFAGRWRQASQVERDAAKPNCGRGGGARAESFGFEG